MEYTKIKRMLELKDFYCTLWLNQNGVLSILVLFIGYMCDPFEEDLRFYASRLLSVHNFTIQEIISLTHLLWSMQFWF